VPVSSPGKFAQFKIYLSGADLDAETFDSPAPGEPPPLARLSNPLPRAVQRVAWLQLALNGAWLFVMLAALAVGAFTIVVMPFALGREGVGLAMVSMFGWSLSAVLTAIPYFAARGAARTLRRDARGPATLRRIAWFVLVVGIPTAFGAHALARIAVTDDVANDTFWFTGAATAIGLALVAVYGVSAVWSLRVLYRFHSAMQPTPASS
jgi:hypothetical protein